MRGTPWIGAQPPPDDPELEHIHLEHIHLEHAHLEHVHLQHLVDHRDRLFG